jgi:phosphatidylglycerophosphatase A
MNKQQVFRWIASCGGLGFSRYAPGTVASFAAAVSLYVLRFFCSVYVLVALTVVLCVLGFFATQKSITTRDDDPSWIVIDEWVAVWSLLVCVPHVWWIFMCGFLVFRLLDIAKPWPICAVEFLPGAWGVFADDLVAAFLTAIFLCCVVIPVIL